MNGRSLVHSANECSTSTQKPNYFGHLAILQLIFDSGTTSTSSAQRSPPSQTALSPSSPILTFHWQSARTTSIGLCHSTYIAILYSRPHSGINLFSSSRQIRKTTRDGNEEVWTEKTYYTTEEAFPTVLRRSEVVDVGLVEISPLENALQEVEDKTKELGALHLKYQALAKTTQDMSTNALAMSLNTAVDAPNNTGIASYRQTFFSPDYLILNPERAELVERLQAAIDDQVCSRSCKRVSHIDASTPGPHDRCLP